MDFIQIIFVAAVTEAIVETIKKIHDFGHDALISLIIAIVLCIFSNTCLFCLVNIKVNIPYLDFILAGVLCSRGSNFLHDFLKIIENAKNNSSIRGIMQ